MANEDSKTEDYAFGLHAVSALLDQSPELISRLWVQSQPRSDRLAEIFGKARAANVRVESVERRWLDQKLGFDARHQGVLAMQQARELADSKALLRHVEAALEADKNSVLLLLLDEIQDARNLGACLRSAEAVGVTAVVVPKRRSAPINSLARKTAAGAAESLFIAGVTNLVRTIEDLQKLGVWVYATGDAANSNYLHANLTGPCALVLGNEETGVRRLVTERCDGALSLPMHGAVESLNVSVATGVLLYEVLRQRGA
jgi:23S rRNA (guanosine2251-2'-O)-methyltransferase